LDKSVASTLVSALKKPATDSPMKKTKPGLILQLKLREIRAVKERQKHGAELTHYDLRVLNDAFWRDGDDTEEMLLQKDRQAVAEELERRKARNTTNN
jgi:hypothetical protein